MSWFRLSQSFERSFQKKRLQIMKTATKMKKVKEKEGRYWFLSFLYECHDCERRFLENPKGMCAFLIHNPRATGGAVTQPPTSEWLVEVCL